MQNHKYVTLLNDARAVQAFHRKGFFRQALEILQMKKRNRGLDASDYFAFRLYDPAYTGSSGIEDFVGWREEHEVPLILNARTGVAPAWDKLTFAIFAHAYALPVPRLRAVYRPGRVPSSALAEAAFDKPEELGTWLRTQSQWPLFAKPSFGERGYGCYRFSGYERATDSLTTRGQSIPIERFTGEIVGRAARRRELRSYKREQGYLFQEALRPHARIVDLLGVDAISGVCVILVRDEAGIEFVSAEWKMIVGENDTDNIRDTSGEVDVASGRLKRVVRGRWPNASLVERMPKTHANVSEFVLPDWEETLALCRRAAAMLPLMRIQHWNVALTDGGPRLLGVDDMGPLSGQAYGKGFLTPRVRAILQRHGKPAKYRLSKRLAERRGR